MNREELLKEIKILKEENIKLSKLLSKYMVKNICLKLSKNTKALNDLVNKYLKGE